MRLYGIALFILMLNLVTVMFNAAGVFDVEITPATHTGNFTNDYLSSQVAALSSGTTQTDTSVITQAITFVDYLAKGMGLIVTVLINSTIGFPSLLANEPINMPNIIVSTLTAIQVIVYLVGFIEFVSGREMGA